MDFAKVKRQIIRAYQNSDTSLSADEVMEIFRIYYDEYFKVMGRQHPHMTTGRIGQIINELDHMTDFEDDYLENVVLSVEDYEQMISSYFKTSFKGCDYSMAHFVSGKIRKYRYYEAVY